MVEICLEQLSHLAGLNSEARAHQVLRAFSIVSIPIMICHDMMARWVHQAAGSFMSFCYAFKAQPAESARGACGLMHLVREIKHPPVMGLDTAATPLTRVEPCVHGHKQVHDPTLCTSAGVPDP